jgi:hypothetical protein
LQTPARNRFFVKFGHSASYAPAEGGAAVSCSVVLNQADDVASIDNIPLAAEQRLVEVRKTDVASPARGDVFTNHRLNSQE